MLIKIRNSIKEINISHIHTQNKKAFTLFEIVLSLIILSMLIGIIFTTYINIKKSEVNIKSEQLIIQESNDLLDKLHELSLDYTIDYEEYFNRYLTNCSGGDSEFIRNKN
jgi:type II secretory pathway pseudopilin PulG